MYVRIEGTRFNFMRLNQANLRAEVYNNMVDYFRDQMLISNALGVN